MVLAIRCRTNSTSRERAHRSVCRSRFLRTEGLNTQRSSNALRRDYPEKLYPIHFAPRRSCTLRIVLQDLFAIPLFLLFLAGVASRGLPGLLLAWLGPGILAPCLILFGEVIQLSSVGLIVGAVLRCFYAPRFADFVTLGSLVEFRQKIIINRTCVPMASSNLPTLA